MLGLPHADVCSWALSGDDTSVVFSNHRSVSLPIQGPLREPVCGALVFPSYIVKNTFIDIETPTPSRTRAFTDSALVIDTPGLKELDVLSPHLSDVSTDASSDAEELPASRGSFADEGLSYQTPASMYPWLDTWMTNPYMQDSWNAMYCDTSAAAWSWPDAACPAETTNAIPADTVACNPPAVQKSSGKSTVMLRNLPNDYTRNDLLQLLDEVGGFAGKYDFVYLPIDFKSQAGLGYAFVNFITASFADDCFEIFEGFTDWSLKSCKVCNVTWGNPLQGLDAHIERYRDSPVMHSTVPDDWKPMLLQDGGRIKFPLPTKGIKPPKIRVR